MKKSYLKPSITEFEVLEKYNLLDPSVGDIPTGEILGKETDVVEDETGVPSNFSNIWGDEEDED